LVAWRLAVCATAQIRASKIILLWAGATPRTKVNVMAHRKAPPVRHDAPGMIGQRSRNQTGELRQKRGDTLAGTIEQQYHVDLDVRSDTKLSTLLKREGVDSLSDLLEQKR
jgi:hypothetical protein